MSEWEKGKLFRSLEKSLHRMEREDARAVRSGKEGGGEKGSWWWRAEEAAMGAEGSGRVVKEGISAAGDKERMTAAPAAAIAAATARVVVVLGGEEERGVERGRRGGGGGGGGGRGGEGGGRGGVGGEGDGGGRVGKAGISAAGAERQMTAAGANGQMTAAPAAATAAVPAVVVLLGGEGERRVEGAGRGGGGAGRGGGEGNGHGDKGVAGGMIECGNFMIDGEAGREGDEAIAELSDKGRGSAKGEGGGKGGGKGAAVAAGTRAAAVAATLPAVGRAGGGRDEVDRDRINPRLSSAAVDGVVWERGNGMGADSGHRGRLATAMPECVCSHPEKKGGGGAVGGFPLRSSENACMGHLSPEGCEKSRSISANLVEDDSVIIRSGDRRAFVNGVGNAVLSISGNRRLLLSESRRQGLNAAAAAAAATAHEDDDGDVVPRVSNLFTEPAAAQILGRDEGKAGGGEEGGDGVREGGRGGETGTRRGGGGGGGGGACVIGGGCQGSNAAAADATAHDDDDNGVPRGSNLLTAAAQILGKDEGRAGGGEDGGDCVRGGRRGGEAGTGGEGGGGGEGETGEGGGGGACVIGGSWRRRRNLRAERECEMGLVVEEHCAKLRDAPTSSQVQSAAHTSFLPTGVSFLETGGEKDGKQNLEEEEEEEAEEEKMNVELGDGKEERGKDGREITKGVGKGLTKDGRIWQGQSRGGGGGGERGRGEGLGIVGREEEPEKDVSVLEGKSVGGGGGIGAGGERGGGADSRCGEERGRRELGRAEPSEVHGVKRYIEEECGGERGRGVMKRPKLGVLGRGRCEPPFLKKWELEKGGGSRSGRKVGVEIRGGNESTAARSGGIFSGFCGVIIPGGVAAKRLQDLY
ncbi:hypothetical protein CBR_g48618 [Chara braunii]|uniref:Uncharacterized protein n=1 Tax=Chara braunii TaxID=69332 RepID=A0A388M3F9_CHABU|nr:hypothetical protein CBR_g48618 [Chara braunii]|eukprot:GBG89009.1 hypothetical protein CBR_g48618 [Chara braunii]